MSPQISKRTVDQFMEVTRNIIAAIDTTNEIRHQAGYQFCLRLGDRLHEMDMPASLAVQASSVINVVLPSEFHLQYPNEFDELIELWAKCINVIYNTFREDYHAEVAPSIFIEHMRKFEVTFSV